MSVSKYLRLPVSEPDEDKDAEADGESSTKGLPVRAARRSHHQFRTPFILSVVGNVLLISYLLFQHKLMSPSVERSKYAGLTRTIPIAWGPNEAINDTEQDNLWDATSYDLGNIALADDYARAVGLPRAQRFPWDNNKGIYLINAYHNLHCVKTLRTALVEFREAQPQSSPWGHVQHCLLVLRDEVMCDADDTPRYTGFQPDQKSGLGQVRMCRDWKQLEQWALEQTACWRHIGEISEEGFRELDRYRFCPEGSPYKEVSETTWLKGDWWRKYKDGR
ncbi:hypothetical protein AbraIFM66950_003118 [Aspergillus brasiliensis]|nr:hypothetical protein AbraIFM66950_003118 [Aspergillus brasiliensis]